MVLHGHDPAAAGNRRRPQRGVTFGLAAAIAAVLALRIFATDTAVPTATAGCGAGAA
jgi:hypothetical protein